MTLYRLTVNLWQYHVGEVVDVPEGAEADVASLIHAGYLLPVEPLPVVQDDGEPAEG